MLAFVITLVAFIAYFSPAAAANAEQYEIGGPLAGLKLPLFSTQHGEEPGYPGNLPGKYDSDPLAPEIELYPNSMEHYRAYMFKYMPIRSFFDRQSMIKNWFAPEIPGAEIEQYSAPVYHVPRHEPPINTGLRLAPVPVIRCKAGSPVLNLELGELEMGLYAVRVIGAVETEKLRMFRLPLYLLARINDGDNGEESIHRLRLGYCDEFYSVAEIYFHARSKRPYRIELTVDKGSEVDLLVYNVTLDDVLTGTERRAIKTHSLQQVNKSDKAIIDMENRTLKDAAIWESFPPINRQGSLLESWGGDEKAINKNIFHGVDGKNKEQIETEFGKWERPGAFDDTGIRGIFLVNKKLGLQYTVEDLLRHKPLPEPYPYKDDGSGLYYPDPVNMGQGYVWAPIAKEISDRIRDYYNYISSKTEEWQRTGGSDCAQDAAVALARWAYSFPTIDPANFLTSVVREEGPYGRDYRCRRRETAAFFLPHYMLYVSPILYNYDVLFDFIKDNQGLADSIGRYIPWIKTPQDVIKLIDVYLVQTTAKRIMRYHYHTGPMEIANIASILGDNSVTDPWMEWLFSRTFIYPLPPVGIQDAMVTGCERDGCEYIGSTFYAQGEGASRVASALENYIEAGGNPKYNLADRELYPKPVAHTYWHINNVVAGWDFLRIGDVSGPDKVPGFTLRDFGFARIGWKWTGDPRFAFIIRHYLGRTDETDEEWAKIHEAANELDRAPWLDNRTRMMSMWATVLESGLEHDDPRFRRAAYVRTGFGVGHEHNDAMDLQIVAHGQPATIDGGQRGGYSTPADRNTRVHNLVEVDGNQLDVYSWTRTLTDAAGARYMNIDSEPPENVNLFRRQVALIDVDEGQGSMPLTIPQQKPGSKLPEGIIPANSYIFDVFRVAGGRKHTYCFHGTVNDAFEWNIPDAAQVNVGDESEDDQYLRMFKNLPETKFSGTAPAILEATWRQKRGKETGYGSEDLMLGQNFDPDQPQHFTRLHLLDTQGARAMRANLDCYQWKYNFTCLMVQKSGNYDRDTVFPAVIEPYAGKPFITSRRLLDIANNETDAQKAVAVQIETANGHTDICFADARSEKVREIPGANMKVSGEFAYFSKDEQGFRQAVIVGGALLDTPDIRLKPVQRERTGKIVKADYLAKTIWVDQLWHARSTPGVLEMGVPGHKTAYTALRIEPDNGGYTRIVLENGADYFRSPVVEVNPQDNTVKCALGLTMGLRAGIDKHWVASDDGMTRFWRADAVGDKIFRLSGNDSLSYESFGKPGVLRLWEYGVDDMVRQSTFASIRRIDEGLYELCGDVDIEISMPGKSFAISRDKINWNNISFEEEDGMIKTLIKVDHLTSENILYIRKSKR